MPGSILFQHRQNHELMSSYGKPGIYETLLWAFYLCNILHGVEGLTAWNCDSLSVNYTSVSLHGASQCPNPKTSYGKPEPHRVQVVQAGNSLEVPAFVCSATHTIVHRVCGFTSLSYGSGGDNVYAEPLAVSGEECLNAVESGRVNILDHTMHVQKGHISRDSWWTQGYEEPDGTCSPASFQFGESYFPSATQKTYVSFKISETKGKLNLGTGQVIFPPGIRGVYKTGWLEDAAEGTIIWSPHRGGDCRDKLSEVYRGLSTLRRRNDLGSDYTLDGSILQIADSVTNQFAGFLLKERVPLCGRLCYQTQIDGALICFFENNRPLFPLLQFKATVYKETTELESKLGALFLDTNLRMYTHFEDLHSDLCRVERMVLSNTLLDLAGGNTLALQHSLGDGYQVSVVGAVAYITKCEGVSVTVQQHQSNCTLEVPVVDPHGTPLFMNALTKILQRYPTVIPCSPILPARFKLAGDWWCLYPQLTLCSSPSTLNTTTGRFEDQVFTENMRGGLYSPEQIRMHERWSEINAARSPLLQLITDRATGSVRSGMPHQFGSIIGEHELEDVSWGVTGILFPIFPMLGRIWLYISGFIMLLFVLRILLDRAWHCWDIYQHHGWSWKLLGGFWSTAHGVIMSPRAMFNSAPQEIRRVRGAVNKLYSYRYAGQEVEERDHIPGFPLPDDDDMDPRRARQHAARVSRASRIEKRRARSEETRGRRRWMGLYPKLSKKGDSSIMSTADESGCSPPPKGNGAHGLSV